MAEPLLAIEPTQDERTMASLAQFLQLVGGWIGPLVILLVKRQSRFVSFHALQVLLLEAVFIFLTMITMMAVAIAIVIGAISGASLPQHSSSGVPPLFFLFFPLFWIAIMGFWLVKLVVAIVYGIKAGRGEWAEYPVLGKLARRVLKIGPGGAAMQA
jgi:uncharacterized membrane protein